MGVDESRHEQLAWPQVRDWGMLEAWLRRFDIFDPAVGVLQERNATIRSDAQSCL